MKPVGYAAVFYSANDDGTEYQLSPSVRERIAPTAFDRALKSSDDVVAAYNHNVDFLLGRRSAGTLKLTKDSRGLLYEISVNESDPQHVSVLAKIRRGDLSGSSFSFLPIKERVESRDGGYIRTVEDLRLFELGPVWMPAYSSTTATARSMATPGSVRWSQENQEAAKRLARVRVVERAMVLDRLRFIDVSR